MSRDDTTTTTFDNAQGLMALANQPSLQADEKPLLTPRVDDADDLEGFDDVTFVDGHKLVYNRASGAPFDCVTDEYEIINPPQFIGPLCEKINERGHSVHGSVWTREHGAKAYAQVLFDDKDAIHLPNRSGTPVKVGFQLRWSHDGGISVKADGFAQDTSCSNSIRQVTSPIHVKHSGDVNDRIDWSDEWDRVLTQLGAFSEALEQIIHEAMSLDLFDFRDSEMGQAFSPAAWRDATDPLDTLEQTTPPGGLDNLHRDTLYGYYSLLGFPKYLAVSATDRLMWRARKTDDPRVLSAWDVHSAATYALTHDHRGTPGASDDDHHRIASDILLNPMQTVDDANRAALEATRDDDDGGPVLAPGTDDDLEDGVGDALRSYHERASEVETAFGGD